MLLIPKRWPCLLPQDFLHYLTYVLFDCLRSIIVNSYLCAEDVEWDELAKDSMSNKVHAPIIGSLQGPMWQCLESCFQSLLIHVSLSSMKTVCRCWCHSHQSLPKLVHYQTFQLSLSNSHGRILEWATRRRDIVRSVPGHNTINRKWIYLMQGRRLYRFDASLRKQNRMVDLRNYLTI